MESTDATERLIVTGKKRLKSIQIFLAASSILLALITSVFCIGILVRYEVESEVTNVDSVAYWKDELPEEQLLWFEKGIEELNLALNMNPHGKIAQNVIIFMANGITIEALAASRFWENNKQAKLMSWDKFPQNGRLKNSCSSLKICDPFTVATSLFGGVRTNFKIGGLDANIPYRNCMAAMNTTHHVKSIIQQAQEVGLRTGFITTQRVTGPTTAALYAHTPDTSWECDVTMPKDLQTTNCLDTAQQLVRSVTGQKINIIMGGGRQALQSNVPATKWDPIDETACNAKDKRNLLRDWRKQKLLLKQRYAVLHNFDELFKLNATAVDYVLGIMANGDLTNILNNQNDKQLVKLKAMLDKSLEVLQMKKSGYLLVVETGVRPGDSRIAQVEELLRFNEVINYTLTSKRFSSDNTLALIVFTNGNYVRKFVDTSSAETEFFQNLYDIVDDDNLLERHLANIVTDTMIYATGPKSHLFHGLHEETYMAHIISYALRMGQFDSKQQQQLEQQQMLNKTEETH